jgi:hypothetical protein
MSDDDDEAGFSFSAEESALVAKKLMDDEPASAPPPEYRSAVVTAAEAHMGGGTVPSLCAGCPGAIWTIGDVPGEVLAPDGAVAKAREDAAWTLAVFCRPQHKDLTSFEPNYVKRRYMVRAGLAVGFCDAFEDELKAWQEKQ